eukprot:TRINITY_DN10252_c0_g1_i1.p1 TRINITY_DN10252_c0_g1~~TRINITY_DN10252_c0_g1_i1.p1  ORF type:complete len:680 (-),score=220.22 TRINITY_DN10252_c0_g1_i1:95-2134(-)
MGCVVSDEKYTINEDIYEVLQRKDLPRVKYLLGRKQFRAAINESSSRLVTLPNHDSFMASVTPLVFAIAIDFTEAVVLMCNNSAVDVNLGFDPESNCKDCQASLSYTPFTVAIALSRKPIFDYMFNHSRVDKDKGCPPPLCVAAMAGNQDAAALLVPRATAGAPFGSFTPLRVAVESQQPRMVSLVLDNITPPDPAGVVYAASHPSTEIVETLMKHPQMDPNALVDFTSPGVQPPEPPHGAFYRAVLGMRSQRRLGTQPKSFPVCTCRRTPALPCLQLLLSCGQVPLCMCADMPYHSPVTGTTILELLLQAESIDPSRGACPLRLAVSQVNLRAIKLLIKHPRLTLDQLRQSLLAAVKDVKDREVTEVMQVLLGHPEAPVSGAEEERSPLMLAARFHRPSALRCLLNGRNADPNATVRGGLAHEAMRLGRGEEPYAPPAGRFPELTPLYAAVLYPGEPDDVFAAVKTLLTFPLIDPNRGFTTSDGWHFSPLICAMEEKRWTIAQEIIAHPRTDVNLCEPSPLDGAPHLNGRSPLMIAIQYDQLETVDRLLISPSVDVSLGMVVSGRRIDCLHYAVTNYKPPFVDAILRNPNAEITSALLTETTQLLQLTDKVHTPQNKQRQQLLLRSATSLLAAPQCPTDRPAQDLRHMVDNLGAGGRGKKGTGPGSKPMLTQLLAGAL